MRLRNIPGSIEAIAAHPCCIGCEPPHILDLSMLFPRKAELHLEIGMGKGQFLMALAAANPQINYIGIEKYHSVLIRALQKYDAAPLDNLRFACVNADVLCDLFAPASIGRIYLNFSDPWPKERHARRRLTSPQYLARYKTILSPGGTLEFKTDNQDLFDWSEEQVQQEGWEILALTKDLHADPVLSQGNIMTEYEQRFSRAGHPICKMIITPRG